MRLNLRILLGLSFALLLSTSAPALADSFQGVNWPALAGMGVLGLVGYKWGRRKQVA
jgi:hypothetical protein